MTKAGERRWTALAGTATDCSQLNTQPQTLPRHCANSAVKNKRSIWGKKDFAEPGIYLIQLTQSNLALFANNFRNSFLKHNIEASRIKRLQYLPIDKFVSGSDRNGHHLITLSSVLFQHLLQSIWTECSS